MVCPTIDHRASSGYGAVMDRTLLLLRHGHAADPVGTADVDRPLSPAGIGQARGRGPRPGGHRIDQVLCSPAARTRQTLEATGVTAPAQYPAGLYLADADTVRTLISETDDEVGTLLVVGHFPGLPLAAADLDPAGAHDHGLDAGLPPAGLIVLQTGADWAALAPGLPRPEITVTAVHTG